MDDNKKARLENVFNYLRNAGHIHTKKDFASAIEVNYTNVTSAFKGNELYLTNGLLKKISNVFPEINVGWLLTGEGEMLKAPQNPFSQMPSQQIEDIVTKTFTERLMEAYRAGEIFPAEVHNRIVAEKDKRIEELQRENWELQKKIEELTK